MKSYSFQAQIQKHEGMDAAYIEFPYDVEQDSKREAGGNPYELHGASHSKTYRCLGVK